jgi:hypothetical protein
VSWHLSTHTKRASVTAFNSGTAGNYDVTVAPAADFEEFWSAVMSSGYDVRFYSADGTALAYNRGTWTYASRAASFRVAALPSSAQNQAVQFFMYWGASTSDGSTAASSGNLISSSAILYAATPAQVINAGPQPVGATSPAVTITKSTGDTILLWWDVASLLWLREMRYNGFLAYEEVQYVNDVLVTTGGSTQASMVTESATKVKDGRYVVTQHQAGTTGTSYTISLDVQTSLGRIFDLRVQLDVTDVQES